MIKRDEVLFKKWLLENQTDMKKKSEEIEIVDSKVVSKVSRDKLESVIESDDGDVEELAKDFKKNGGIVSEADGNKYMVVVESGEFIIHKMYVKIKKE